MISSCDTSYSLLLVEADPSAMAAAQRSCAVLGIEADYAGCVEDALKCHANSPYRVIVSNDPDLCQKVRGAQGPYVYFLLCGSRVGALDAGVDDFLQTPIDPEELRVRLRAAHRILANEDLATKRAEDEERSALHTAELDESLRLASRRFEDLFNGLPVACFTFDLSGGIHEWNQAAEEAFGIAAFDTLMRPVWEILSESGGEWTPARCEAFFAGSGHEEFDWTYRSEHEAREFACRIITLRGRSGRAVGAVCANVDVTAHKRVERILATEKASLEDANARLHELASKDGLTGLLNRRSFLSDLEAALAAYASTGKPFSLVLLDIDRFKSYNDTYGHPAGDEVLRRFARVLRSTARSSEKPARYGGEEFAIVLHGTGAPMGLAAAERFRRAVQDADWIERGVTCSLGVASVGINGTTTESLIAAADAALYASKQSGRNRSSHAVSLPGKPGERLAA